MRKSFSSSSVVTLEDLEAADINKHSWPSRIQLVHSIVIIIAEDLSAGFYQLWYKWYYILQIEALLNIEQLKNTTVNKSKEKAMSDR